METENNRSSFITVLAWIFIIISGYSALISLAQNLLIGFMVDPSLLNEFSNASSSEAMPIFFQFMISNMHLLIFSCLIVAVLTFISSIALLKRKNWARIFFMVLMGLSIGSVILSFVMQFLFIQEFMPDMQNQNESKQFMLVLMIMRVFMFLFSVAFCGLFGWIMKKLSSEKIKEEFLINYY